MSKINKWLEKKQAIDSQPIFLRLGDVAIINTQKDFEEVKKQGKFGEFTNYKVEATIDGKTRLVELNKYQFSEVAQKIKENPEAKTVTYVRTK